MAKPKVDQQFRADFAQRLNDALDNVKFPQYGRTRRLAERFGVSPAAAANWVVRGAIPQMDLLQEIATMCGVTAEYLLSGQGQDVARSSSTLARALELALPRIRDLTPAEGAAVVSLLASLIEQGGTVVDARTVDVAVQLSMMKR